jgi:flagellar biogenesis protein FliO
VTVAIAARAALVLLLLAACVVLARRRSRGAPPASPVEIVARASLGPAVGLALLEVGRRRLLVGWGKDGVRLVSDLGTPESAP